MKLVVLAGWVEAASYDEAADKIQAAIKGHFIKGSGALVVLSDDDARSQDCRRDLARFGLEEAGDFDPSAYRLRTCACGRELYQRDDLWEGQCVTCVRRVDPSSGFFVACGAQDWAYGDEGEVIIYGTCQLPQGHENRLHREDRDGTLWAGWFGRSDERAPV